MNMFKKYISIAIITTLLLSGISVQAETFLQNGMTFTVGEHQPQKRVNPLPRQYKNLKALEVYKQPVHGRKLRPDELELEIPLRKMMADDQVVSDGVEEKDIDPLAEKMDRLEQEKPKGFLGMLIDVLSGLFKRVNNIFVRLLVVESKLNITATEEQKQKESDTTEENTEENTDQENTNQTENTEESEQEQNTDQQDTEEETTTETEEQTDQATEEQEQTESNATEEDTTEQDNTDNEDNEDTDNQQEQQNTEQSDNEEETEQTDNEEVEQSDQATEEQEQTESNTTEEDTEQQEQPEEQENTTTDESTDNV